MVRFGGLILGWTRIGGIWSLGTSGIGGILCSGIGGIPSPVHGVKTGSGCFSLALITLQMGTWLSASL